MKQGSPATEKAREIIRRLQTETDNADGVVQNDDVELAIEDIAGADRRTIRKYKRIFRRRGLLFEHPAGPDVWTLHSEQWLSWIEDFAGLNGAEAAREIVTDYPASVTVADGTLQIELAEVGADE